MPPSLSSKQLVLYANNFLLSFKTNSTDHFSFLSAHFVAQNTPKYQMLQNGNANKKRKRWDYQKIQLIISSCYPPFQTQDILFSTYVIFPEISKKCFCYNTCFQSLQLYRQNSHYMLIIFYYRSKTTVRITSHFFQHISSTKIPQNIKCHKIEMLLKNSEI